MAKDHGFFFVPTCGSCHVFTSSCLLIPSFFPFSLIIIFVDPTLCLSMWSHFVWSAFLVPDFLSLIPVPLNFKFPLLVNPSLGEIVHAGLLAFCWRLRPRSQVLGTQTFCQPLYMAKLRMQVFSRFGVNCAQGPRCWAHDLGFEFTVLVRPFTSQSCAGFSCVLWKLRSGSQVLGT